MGLRYMDNMKNDHYYLQKIRQDLEFIVLHMHDVDIEELNANYTGTIGNVFRIKYRRVYE